MEVNLNIPDHSLGVGAVKFSENPNSKIVDFRTLLKNDKTFCVHYQKPFLEWILNLPQLKPETLLLYKIRSLNLMLTTQDLA